MCAEVEKYQESYVCYASTGYMCEASGLSVIRTHGSAQPITARLDIVTAPAEYCLPIKKDRRFAPEFTVQACPPCPHVSVPLTAPVPAGPLRSYLHACRGLT